MRYVALLNILALAISVGLFLALRWIVREFGGSTGLTVALCLIAAAVVHQLWHKRRYGVWYEGAVIKLDDDGKPLP